MNIQPEKTLSVSLQTQTLDFRVLSTFDVILVHHSQTELIEEISTAFPNAIYSLEQELLSYHMIVSPVMITLTSDIINILEAHLQHCELLSRNNGLFALLDYTPPNIRANKTRISAAEYLPQLPEWQQLDITDENEWLLDTVQLAKTLGFNQIIQKGGKKKNLRYLDAQVLIHLLPLNQHHYIANRYAHPQRLWLPLGDNWYSLDNIHHYKPDQIMQAQRLPSYCPLTQIQLDNISVINRFFAKKGIEGSNLILSHYGTLLRWLDKSNTQLTSATHLTNPVDRMTMMNRWLYECYEQTGLVTLDN